MFRILINLSGPANPKVGTIKLWFKDLNFAIQGYFRQYVLF